MAHGSVGACRRVEVGLTAVSSTEWWSDTCRTRVAAELVDVSEIDAQRGNKHERIGAGKMRVTLEIEKGGEGKRKREGALGQADRV
eukprot:6183394-Pleurochrysis_carterae.AAC.2